MSVHKNFEPWSFSSPFSRALRGGTLFVLLMLYVAGYPATLWWGGYRCYSDVSMFPLSDTGVTGQVVVKVKSVLRRLYYMHKPKTNMSWVSSYYTPPWEDTLCRQRQRLQGDVEMTVDDMLRLLREGGGLERLSRDASAVSALCWHYCRSRRGKLRLSDSHFVAIFSSLER